VKFLEVNSQIFFNQLALTV